MVVLGVVWGGRSEGIRVLKGMGLIGLNIMMIFVVVESCWGEFVDGQGRKECDSGEVERD